MTKINFFGREFVSCKRCGSSNINAAIEDANKNTMGRIEFTTILLSIECEDCGNMVFDREHF